MKKIKWFEVYGLVDSTDSDSGTETKETFDTYKEAKQYCIDNKDLLLSIDEWEMYEDGTQLTKINNN